MGDENEKYFIPCCMKFQYAVEESLPQNVISVQNLLSFEKIEIILHEDVSDSCIYLTPSHTTHNETAKKCSYLPYTLQLFFTTATIFFNSFLYEQRFSHRLFKKNLCSFVYSV